MNKSRCALVRSQTAVSVNDFSNQPGGIVVNLFGLYFPSGLGFRVSGERLHLLLACHDGGEPVISEALGWA